MAIVPLLDWMIGFSDYLTVLFAVLAWQFLLCALSSGGTILDCHKLAAEKRVQLKEVWDALIVFQVASFNALKNMSAEQIRNSLESRRGIVPDGGLPGGREG